MATNDSRSMNHDLSEGMTDGKYKKIATNERGGNVDPATAKARVHLYPAHYGFIEAPVKVRGDNGHFS